MIEFVFIACANVGHNHCAVVISPNTQPTEITDLQNTDISSTLIINAGSFIRLFVSGAHDFVEMARG